MRVEASTTLFAVFGDPVAHSKSPVMLNTAFEETGFDGVYAAFAVRDIAAAADAVRTLSIGGASITIPHKVSIMAHLDSVDDTAGKIGAVNTLVNRDGRLSGYNSDWQGAVRALSEKTEIAGKTVMLIGAGGAARAVAYGVTAEGGRLLVVNRTQEKAEQLAAEFSGRALPLSEAARWPADILVNTTPVGMAPSEDGLPVSEEALKAGRVVMDIIYNPLRTPLLQAAESRGCETVDGLAMFVYQGAAQFERWTGMQAPVALMRAAVLEALKKG